jgi:hypothetical protein
MSAHVPSDYLAAARRYGPSLDHVASRYTNPYTGHRLTGEQLLLKVGAGESGFQWGKTSSQGARGPTQFIASTRRAVIQKYGIDPWKNTDQAVHAAALHLRGLVNGSPGLEGYNPGSKSYPSYILGQKIGHVDGGSRPTSDAGAAPMVPGNAPQDVLGALAQTPAPAQAPVTGPQTPSFAAGPTMPAGYQAPSAPPQAPAAPSTEQLAALIGNMQAPQAAPTGGGDAPAVQASGNFPLSKRGKIIGTPYAGTHRLGNWQSDNAIDISTPTGTPVIATQDGLVAKTKRGRQDGGRFAGDQVTLQSRTNAFFYTHLSRLAVKPGQRVRKGDVLGYSGSANGVEHLHFAMKHGDPRAYGR